MPPKISNSFDFLQTQISKAQEAFRLRLTQVETAGGLSRESYTRYLRMQYHLTKDVQRHFMMCASHPELATRRSLREFLFNFAIVEEPHYRIAQHDLELLGALPGERPLDVDLWWAYLNSVVFDQPFIRLGATCILENIADKSHELIDRLLRKTDYLTPQNTRFITIHKHGPNLAHGDEILEALQGADLEERHLKDLERGARFASLQYLRMAEWALGGTENS